ncbi:MAG: NAD-dependent deacylase [Bacteroidetes bacterium]|nr:NAD-dependent deacylase [Bacteroidota bacterium]
MKIVIFSGAGISAESGIKTFRDSGGLWEDYNIDDVATPEGWRKNFELVLDFYNQRRKQVMEAKPNDAHQALVELEQHFDVKIITQNIDDLHERAGSKNVLHLHGEIKKSKSTLNPSIIYDIEGWELHPGQNCEKGSQLRPHVVWFGEEVPEMENAARMVSEADVLIVIGTSLNVYPAASLLYYAKPGARTYLIGPEAETRQGIGDLHVIKELASKGVRGLVKRLIHSK